MRFLKKLLVCVYIFLAIFSVTVLVLFTLTGYEPTALVGCVFGVAGVESMLSAVIKAKEVKKDGNTSRES